MHGFSAISLDISLAFQLSLLFLVFSPYGVVGTLKIFYGLDPKSYFGVHQPLQRAHSFRTSFNLCASCCVALALPRMCEFEELHLDLHSKGREFFYTYRSLGQVEETSPSLNL